MQKKKKNIFLIFHEIKILICNNNKNKSKVFKNIFKNINFSNF